MAKHYWCRYLYHLYPILSPSLILNVDFFRGLMLSAISYLILKIQRVFAHARKSATVCNPCLKTVTILWFSWVRIICDEYWPSQNSWTTLLRPSGLMFPKDGRMVLVLPAWRGFQQMVRKHRVHRPTLPRDVKVNKHQVERAKLSTQLGNASSNGFESRSI